LLAWALRLVPILDHRFHPDEALYGYWGLLIAHGKDPWLAAVPVYKPPLLPYLIAGVQALFGNSEFSVRLPGLAAGLMTVPLVAALAHSLYRDRWIAAAAAIGVALSPFSILFSSTAFTDPLMVTLGLGACVAAARGRVGWAGALAGLAFATKQTGLVWAPLVALLYVANCSRYKRASDSRLQRADSELETLNPKPETVWSLVLCFSLVVGLTIAWDGMRVVQGAESYWRVGVTGYGGLRLIWPQELWARLRGWVELARYLFVSPVVNGVLLVGLVALVWSAITHRRHTRKPVVDTRKPVVDLVLVSFLLLYSLLHWLVAFPIWDRYLLPLVPILAVLLGRTLILAISYLQPIIGRSSFVIRRWSFVFGHLLLVVFLMLPAWNAARSHYPIGSRNDACDSIDQVAAFLRDLPEGAVVYQHWLGWQYAYYLFDGPAYLAYWPTPAWLAQDVLAFGAADPRYITFPSWESSARVERALAGVGYGLEPVLTTTRRDGTSSFTVYHIQPLPD
jgi:hypothetical protein